MSGFQRTISATAHNRPDLFRNMLVSLAANNLSGWHVIVAVEPGPDQQANIDIAREIVRADQLTILANQTQLGVRKNPLNAINHAFEIGSEINLCVEDDFILAPDALGLVAWYQGNHQPHWAALNLMAGHCGGNGFLSYPEQPDALFETKCFNSLGVAFTRKDWARARSIWEPLTHFMRDSDDTAARLGWDWALLNWIVRDKKLRVVQPTAARCQHMGETGTYCRPSYQARAFSRLAISTRSHLQGQDSQFNLTAIDDLDQNIAAHAHSHADAMAYLAEVYRLERGKNSRLRSFLRGVYHAYRERSDK